MSQWKMGSTAKNNKNEMSKIMWDGVKWNIG